MTPPRMARRLRRPAGALLTAGCLLLGCAPSDPNPGTDRVPEASYDPTIPRRALGWVMGDRIRGMGLEAGDTVLVLYTSRQDELAVFDIERVIASIREGLGNPEVRVVGRDIADRPGYSTLRHYDEPLTVAWISRQIDGHSNVRAVLTFHGLPHGEVGQARDWPPLLVHVYGWTDEAQAWLDAGRIRFAAISRPRIRFDTVQTLPAESWSEWFVRYYTARAPDLEESAPPPLTSGRGAGTLWKNE